MASWLVPSSPPLFAITCFEAAKHCFKKLIVDDFLAVSCKNSKEKPSCRSTDTVLALDKVAKGSSRNIRLYKCEAPAFGTAWTRAQTNRANLLAACCCWSSAIVAERRREIRREMCDWIRTASLCWAIKHHRCLMSSQPRAHGWRAYLNRHSWTTIHASGEAEATIQMVSSALSAHRYINCHWGFMIAAEELAGKMWFCKKAEYTSSCASELNIQSNILNSSSKTFGPKPWELCRRCR